MDAVAVLQFGVHAFRAAEALPAGLHRQHGEPHPQFARHDAHDLLVAAMRIDEDQLPHAGAGDRSAKLGPGVDQRRRRQGQRARRIKVLVRLADRLDREEADVEIVGQMFDHRFQHALHDRGVGRHRQMRAVLFDRRDRDHGDGDLGVDRGVFGGPVVAPPGASVMLGQCTGLVCVCRRRRDAGDSLLSFRGKAVPFRLRAGGKK